MKRTSNHNYLKLGTSRRKLTRTRIAVLDKDVEENNANHGNQNYVKVLKMVQIVRMKLNQDCSIGKEGESERK